MFGFSLDFSVDINIAVLNLHGFARPADEAFDIVFFGIGGIFEYDHIPAFRFGKLIEVFENQNPIAIADPMFVIFDFRAAQWTFRGDPLPIQLVG